MIDLGEGGMELKGDLSAGSRDYKDVGRGDGFTHALQRQGVSGRGNARSSRSRLSEIVAGEIIPRLRLAHTRAVASAPSRRQMLSEQIAEFAQLTMLTDNSAASRYFAEMRASEVSVDTLFVDLLAPTARYLLDMVNDDRCDFVDFTMGMARLRQFLAIFGAPEQITVHAMDRRAVLVTTPSEKHVFERDLVAALMCRTGWDTSATACRGARDAAALVSQDGFDIFHMTLSNRAELNLAAVFIKAVRRASLNAAIRIIVGGSVFAEDPALAIQVGADAAATDLASTPVVAETLIQSPARIY